MNHYDLPFITIKLLIICYNLRSQNSKSKLFLLEISALAKLILKTDSVEGPSLNSPTLLSDSNSPIVNFGAHSIINKAYLVWSVGILEPAIMIKQYCHPIFEMLWVLSMSTIPQKNKHLKNLKIGEKLS